MTTQPNPDFKAKTKGLCIFRKSRNLWPRNIGVTIGLYLLN